MAGTIAVLSMGRCGSNAARRRMENGFPGTRVLHLHSFCFDRLHFAMAADDRRAQFHAGVGMPDWDAEQAGYCARVRDGTAMDLRILLMVREPIARQVSAWKAFRNGEGDFAGSFDHGGVAGWFGRQVRWFLGVPILDGFWHGCWERYERPGLRMAVVRQEDLERDLDEAASWVAGERIEAGKIERINDSPKIPDPVVPPLLADRLHGMRWARRWYTPEELAAARRRYGC